MPKPIKFRFADSETAFEMHKVDRSKLYGYKELEVLDDQGRPCELTTLASDGRTLIGKGGTGIGYLDADGNWSEKDALRPVDLQGNSISPVPSSFAAPIELQEETTVDHYLEHNVRLAYELDYPESDDQLAIKLKSGAIFSFPYSYRGGLEADTGFLMANQDGVIFLLVGSSSKIEFKGLHQSAAVTTVEDEDAASDLMDFDMI